MPVADKSAVASDDSHDIEHNSLRAVSVLQSDSDSEIPRIDADTDAGIVEMQTISQPIEDV